MTVVTAPVGGQPMGIAVDSGHTYGRAFVADRASDRLSVLFGRSPDLTIECQLPVGPNPNAVAVDTGTGRVLVALRGDPRLVVVDGRASTPVILGTVSLEAVPGWVAIDQQTGRAFVSLPELDRVTVLDRLDGPPWYGVASVLSSGPYPRWLAVDQASGRLVISNDGQPETAAGDQGRGSVVIFDGRAPDPIQLGEPVAASVPSGIAFDPRTGNAFILENGSDTLMTLAWPTDGGTPAVSRIAVDPDVDASQNVNPVDLVFLPATRELVVTLASRDGAPGRLDVLRVDEGGRPAFDRVIPSAEHTTGIALDPVTGRVLVSWVDDGLVSGLDLDEPTQSAPPAPITESLPGPLEISLAPEDVARTVGISILVLLLVGAPTPLFNETLESNMGQIEGWLGRPFRRGRSSAALARASQRVRAFGESRWALAAYLLIAALIYSFLFPGFPTEDGLLVFGVALLGIVVGNAADSLPARQYAIRVHGDRGVISVATWTLALAAVTVLISRMADLQPGFMYGIIGTFTFAATLSVADRGRMEVRGAVALLAIALAAWFVRIPFEPTPGIPASGPTLIVNAGLVGIFVVAVEALVFGLIPLRFLPGRNIWEWSRPRLLVLWGAGLVLFVHVLAYPVTVATPNPDPATLTTTLWSAGIYGAVAIGFWLLFRWRGRTEGALAEQGAPEDQPAAE
jgi:DNA-binding beta-propeller fold protein YncE